MLDKYENISELGTFHIVGLEQDNELTPNYLVNPILYNKSSEILLSTNIYFKLNGQTINNQLFKGEIKTVYIQDSTYLQELLNNTNYMFVKDKIQVIHENPVDNKYYVLVYKKMVNGQWQDQAEFIPLPKGQFQFDDGWNTITTVSTFNSTFIPLFQLYYNPDLTNTKFDQVYEVDDEYRKIKYLQPNLKYSYSKIYSQFTQLKNQINVTNEKIELVSQQDINHVFESDVQLIGNIKYYDNNGFKYISIVNENDTNNNQVVVLNNTDYVNLYGPSYKLNEPDYKFYLTVSNGFVDRLFGLEDTNNFPTGQFDLGSIGGYSSEGVVYIVKEEDGKWYYLNPTTNSFEVMPQYTDPITSKVYAEGEFDDRLYKIQFVEIENFELKNLFKHQEFFIDKPYSNTQAIDISGGQYIELRTFYIPPDQPTKQVKTSIKIGNPSQQGEVGNIILDGNVVINGNVIQNGTISFDSLYGDVKQGFYSLTFNPVFTTTRNDNGTILSPIKTIQVNAVRNTDNYFIPTLDNIKVFKNGTQITVGQEIENGVILNQINLSTSQIELNCANQTYDQNFTIETTFTDNGEIFVIQNNYIVDYIEVYHQIYKYQTQNRYVFKYNPNTNTYLNNTIIIKGYYKVGDEQPAYNPIYAKYGTNTVYETNGQIEITTTETIEIQIYDVQTDYLIDTITFTKLVEGEDTYNIILDNENVSIPANEYGIPETGLTQISNITVFKGTTDITNSCTFTQTQTNCTQTITGNQITLSNFAENSNGDQYIDVTYNSQIIGSKRIVFTLNKRGLTGKYIEYRFKNQKTQPQAPIGDNPADWSLTQETPLSDEYTWMSKQEKHSDGTLVEGEEWSTPTRLSGTSSSFITSKPLIEIPVNQDGSKDYSNANFYVKYLQNNTPQPITISQNQTTGITTTITNNGTTQPTVNITSQANNGEINITVGQYSVIVPVILNRSRNITHVLQIEPLNGTVAKSQSDILNFKAKDVNLEGIVSYVNQNWELLATDGTVLKSFTNVNQVSITTYDYTYHQVLKQTYQNSTSYIDIYDVYDTYLVNIVSLNGSIVQFRNDGTVFPTDGFLSFEAKVYDTNTVLQNPQNFSYNWSITPEPDGLNSFLYIGTQPNSNNQNWVYVENPSNNIVNIQIGYGYEDTVTLNCEITDNSNGNKYYQSIPITIVKDGEGQSYILIEAINGTIIKNKSDPSSLTFKQQYFKQNSLIQFENPSNIEWYLNNTIVGSGTEITLTPQNFNLISNTLKVKYGELEYSINILNFSENVNIEIKSSNGNTFKNGNVSTILEAITYVGQNIITTGLTYQWYKIQNGVRTVLTGKTSKTLTIIDSDVSKQTTFECEVSYNGNVYTGSITLLDITDAYYVAVDMQNSQTTFESGVFVPDSVIITPKLLQDDIIISSTFTIYLPNGASLGTVQSGSPITIDYTSIFSVEERQNINNTKQLKVTTTYNSVVYSQNIVVNMKNSNYTWLQNWNNHTQITDESIATGKLFAGQNTTTGLSGIYIVDTQNFSGLTFKPGITQVKDDIQMFSLYLEENNVYLNIGDSQKYLKYDMNNGLSLQQPGFTLNSNGLTLTQGNITLGTNKIHLANDGSGYLASGNISWTKDGVVTLSAPLNGQDIIGETISADALDQDNIFSKNYVIKNGGQLYSEGHPNFLDTVQGLWLGKDTDSKYKFTVGDTSTSKYFQFNGTNTYQVGDLFGQFIGDTYLYNTEFKKDPQLTDTFSEIIYDQELQQLYRYPETGLELLRTFGSEQQYILALQNIQIQPYGQYQPQTGTSGVSTYTTITQNNTYNTKVSASNQPFYRVEVRLYKTFPANYFKNEAGGQKVYQTLVFDFTSNILYGQYSSSTNQVSVKFNNSTREVTVDLKNDTGTIIKTIAKKQRSDIEKIDYRTFQQIKQTTNNVVDNGMSYTFTTRDMGHQLVQIQADPDQSQETLSPFNNGVTTNSVYGIIKQRTFDGTATQAYFADLQEKIWTDEELEKGIPVQIKKGKIVKAYNPFKKVWITSTNPGFILGQKREQQISVGLAGTITVNLKQNIDDEICLSLKGNLKIANFFDKITGKYIIGKVLKTEDNKSLVLLY